LNHNLGNANLALLITLLMVCWNRCTP